MNIAKYIKELLSRYDRVSVLDFGTFLTSVNPSKVNYFTRVISPPQKIISFESGTVVNAHLLVDYISEKKDLSIPEAKNLVEIELNSWKNSLQEGEIEVNSIGYLSYSRLGKLEFEPIRSDNFLPSSFGLAPISYEAVDPVGSTPPISFKNNDFTLSNLKEATSVIPLDIEEEEEELIATPPLPKLDTSFYKENLTSEGKRILELLRENVKEDIPEEVTLEKEEEEEDEKDEIKPNKTPFLLKFLIGITIIAAITTVAWFQYLAHMNNKTNAERKINLDSQYYVEHGIQEASFYIENPLPAISLTIERSIQGVAQQLLEPIPHYHLIAGAFRVQENARNQVASLIKKGYKAAVVGKNKHGLVVVAYESFATEEEAQEALNKINREVDTNAWIWIKE